MEKLKKKQYQIIPSDKLRRIQYLIERMQQRLRVQDWDIEVSMNKPEKSEHLFEIAMNRRRKHAAIRISDKALSLPIGSKEFQTGLSHELVHLIFDEMDYWARNAVPFAGPSAVDYESYEELRERAVDHITKVLYDSLSK